ncbi:MAG: ATP-binding protein, partial [Planctomycetota bacterium]
METTDWIPSPRPGYRLKKLEVTNWGTFDSTTGKVYQLAPEGRTSLLVGQNGSGKSTLVDTLLTLLVQPGVRNYNVAAGAKKRERDERTYIRGACGRSSDDEAGSVTDYLRGDDKHYSVLLACFERESTGDAFTVCQVLQILGDGDVDKTYAYAECEKSIADDLAGLTRSEKIRKQLIDRGFKATTKYSEYQPWVAKKTGMRAKAMDIFNQTVAVKDIQSLNRFIRDHMLEGKPWRDRIENLLSHFSQLSQAHQSLVRARRQIELLEPIETASAELNKLNSELSLYQQQLDATDSFFKQRAMDWLEPRMLGNADQLEKSRKRKLELDAEIEQLENSQRQIRNEIDTSGGERLRQLPLQLETQQALLTGKKRERSRLLAAVKQAGLEYVINGREDFERLPEALEAVHEDQTHRSTEIASKRLELARSLTAVRSKLEEEQTQIQFLEQQPGNLPGWLAELRDEMARELGLEATELPFACELIAVAEDALEWQPAIELVLRRFALTMIVPDEHYRAVSQYVNNHRLVDRRGRGQKLVYSRAVESKTSKAGDKLHNDSLIRKVKLLDDHRLARWINQQLVSRYDFRCCESLDQFQRAPGLAITKERHVKFGKQNHEKDDRDHWSDPRRFVLGWDNARQLTELHSSLAESRNEEAHILEEIQDLETQSKRISKQLSAIETVQSFADFDAVDTHRHESEIAKLEQERTAIEESNDTVRLLRERLDSITERRRAAQQERDESVATETNMLRESQQSAHLREKYESVLEQRRADGSLNEHVVMFEQLEESLGAELDQLKDILDFNELQHRATQDIQQALNRLSAKTEPLQADIIRAMQKFLSDSPEEKNDLRADLLYLDGFIGLLEQLRKDDLPKYEQRFQERLNDKVIQEIGVFHAALQCERQEIISKIEVLNASLEQLEYRAGTHMRLEPRNVSDREIRDFQALLRECLDD